MIAGQAYRSRLLVGTGKYRDFAQTREAVVADIGGGFVMDDYVMAKAIRPG